MTPHLEVESFLKKKGSIIDLRSPVEYEKGHIPTAYSLPLLSNQERVHIGTLYKQKGKQIATETAFALITPKLPYIISEINNFPSPYHLYCSRGGMRSQSIASFLELIDYHPFTLKGGYKHFRQWVLSQFNKPWKLHLIGGYTGVGKTDYLYLLKKKGNRSLI